MHWFTTSVVGIMVLAGGLWPTPLIATVSPLSATSERSTPSAQLTRTDLDAWLDGFMPYALGRGDVAGAVIVVVKDGTVITQRGYGYADVELRKTVDPDATLFRLGSVSKLVTWTAIMQLVEQGKLDLDEDVNSYLDFRIPLRDGKPITLRNIMTHTAGFEESIRGIITSDAEEATPIAKVVKRWTPERIFAPGTTPAYSNYATTLAGYIVERVTQQPFDEYVAANIFARTAMTRSSFRQPLPTDLQALLSRGYALGSDDPKPFEILNNSPGGGMSATGADVAKFMIAHLSGGEPLLQPATAQQMQSASIRFIPPLNSMALGFYEQNVNDKRVIGHGGDTQWFHSYLWLVPSDKVGLFIAMNSTGVDGASSGIRAALIDRFAERYFPAPHVEQRPFVASGDHAAMMAGTYVSSRRAESSFFKALELAGQLRIRADEKGAVVVEGMRGIGGQSRRWVEVADFVWRAADSQERMAATVVDGKIQRLSFDAISPFLVFEPAAWNVSSAWLKPGLLLALGVLAITGLSWPVGAFLHWRYRARHSLVGRDLAVYRLVCGFATLTVSVFFGWAKTLTAMMGDFELFNGELDGLVLLLQVAGVLSLSGLFGTALWWVRRTTQGKASWANRVWSILVAVSAFVTSWVAVNFNLLKFGLEY